MDVVNQGMNGYNSRWGVAALPFMLEEMLGPAVYSVNDAVADKSTEKESRAQEQQTKKSESNQGCLNDEQEHHQLLKIKNRNIHNAHFS